MKVLLILSLILLAGCSGYTVLPDRMGECYVDFNFAFCETPKEQTVVVGTTALQGISGTIGNVISGKAAQTSVEK